MEASGVWAGVFWEVNDVCCDVAPACNNPRWIVRYQRSAHGATSRFYSADVQGCLDDCVATPTCIGVDVNHRLNTVVCWPHMLPDAFVESNIYYQPGTTSYQLLERCATTTNPGTTNTSTGTSSSTTLTTTTTTPTPTTTTTIGNVASVINC